MYTRIEGGRGVKNMRVENIPFDRYFQVLIDNRDRDRERERERERLKCNSVKIDLRESD